MKKKSLKLMIFVLFILFNTLSLIVYMHILNKMNNHAIYELKTNLFNEINIDEKYQNEKIVHYKLSLTNEENNSYQMIMIDDNYKNLYKLFNDENELYKYIYESEYSDSQFNVNEKVYNFKNEFGILLKDNYMNIEVYEKEKIFNSNIEFKDFDNIVKVLGDTTIVKNKLENYDYYALIYKDGDYYVEFISFYEDGRNSICIISKDIIM